MRMVRIDAPVRRRLQLTLAAALCGASLLAGAHAGRAQTRSEFVPTFSTNSRVKQQVERLTKLAQDKQWDAWLGAYQQLVDDPRDLVIPKDDEFLVGVRWHCHQLLAGLPAGVRQRYRALYDNEARKLYDRALADRDAAGMREVYARYRFSSHAGKALLWLANEAQDTGRHEWARVAYSRLAKDPVVSPNLLLRWALSAHSAGNDAEAKAVLERVKRDFGAQPMQLAGQQVTGSQAADQVARSFRSAAAGAGPEWTSFAGESGDRRWEAGPTGKLKKLWEFVQPAAAETPRYFTSQQVLIGGYGRTGSRFSMLSFPAVRGDRIWVQGQRNLTAVNAADGKAVWDAQDFVLTPDEMAATDPDSRLRGTSYRSVRAYQAAPALDNGVVVARVAMLSAPGSTARWPADFALGAWDARTGRQLWRRTAGGEPRGSFFNIPAAKDGVVISGVATNKGGITEYNAVALDGGTGEQLWSTYLGAGSDPTGVLDGSPATVRDGTVWIESSLYTLNALDLITGEVRLVYHYDPGQRTTYGGINSVPSLTNEAISAIAVGPRSTIDKKEVTPVIFAPRWGVYVIALDAETGRLLWSTPKAPGGRSTSGSLFGVDAKHAYVCGEHIQAINLADGAPDWTWEAQKVASSDLGFAALAGDRIYMPVEGRLYVLSAAEGRELEKLDAVNSEEESPGFAAVIPFKNLLLMSTRDRVVAFGPAQ